METFICGDIGGTNSRFQLFVIARNDNSIGVPVKSGKLPSGALKFSQKYHNENYTSFAQVLRQFLMDSQSPSTPVTACFAVAGPVKDNAAFLTNRGSWEINGAVLERELNIQTVRIVNDFLAIGYGLLTLDEATECVTLQDAPKNPAAPIACIGAGTGLGECFLTPDANGKYSCYPSEGGHAEFAPRNELESGLLNFLKHKFEQKHRVSVERVISGRGLMNVYEYLSLTFPERIDSDVHQKILAAGDQQGAVIATNQQCLLCKQTMDIFITAYGAEAGVAALKWMPFGGLYLTGGLTPKNIDLIRAPNGPFIQAMLDKGRVSGMLSAVPVFAVLVEDVGERGAHLVAFQEYQRIRSSAASSKPDALVKQEGRSCHWCSIFTERSFTASVGVALAFLALSKFVRKSV